MRMIIFISVAFIVFGLSGYYVFNRINQSFEGTFVNSTVFLIFYIFLVSSFFIGKVVEHFSIGFVSNAFVKIGSIGIGFFVYAFLFALFFDFIRLINFALPFYPEFITANYQKTKLIIGLISLSIISIIFISGYINALNPKVKKIDISINKSTSGFDKLNIVAVSDIHLGTMVNKTKIKKLIKIINDINPDVVIIGGDIIDDNLDVVKHFKLLDYFKEVKSKYGIYSCMGNHEYISRAFKDLDYFEKKGIHILKDSTIKIDDKFYIIGRDDIEGRSINGKARKSLKELTKEIDFNHPVILLDHQPYKLEKTAEFPVDLQFSGHTHNGQFWPFNYITGLIFEKDWGYLKKKNTHFYISCGYGTSVVPIRVGNKPEVINFRISSK